MTIRANELPTPEELEAFFFESMCATGWSSLTPEIIPHPNLFGWKQTLHHKSFGGGHALLLTDSWGGGKGLTKITLRLKEGGGILLWVMHYKHGTIFPKDSLPFLTGTLNRAYAARRFYGGRGESVSSSLKQIDYKNRSIGEFHKFSGTEIMERWSSTHSCYVVVGDTEYWGGCTLG